MSTAKLKTTLSSTGDFQNMLPIHFDKYLNSIEKDIKEEVDHRKVIGNFFITSTKQEHDYLIHNVSVFMGIAHTFNMETSNEDYMKIIDRLSVLYLSLKQILECNALDVENISSITWGVSSYSDGYAGGDFTFNITI